MSAAPIPPDGEPVQEGPRPTPDPAEVALHRKRALDKTLTVMERLESAKWLTINVPEDEVNRARKPRKSKTAPTLSQGNPNVIPMPGRGRKVDREPKNLEAEFMLISQLMADPSSLGPIVDQLDPDHFAGESHRLIIAYMIERHRDGSPIERIGMADDLSRQYVFVETGGKEILERAAVSPEKTTDTAELLRVIASNAERRKAWWLSKDLERVAAEGGDLDGDLLHRVRGTIESISTQAKAVEWERPLLDDREAPEPFPLDVLPKPLKQFVENASRIVHFPIDYLAVPCLTIAGAGIGRSVGIRINEAWVEHPCFYSLVVGNPGTAKSAAIVKLSPLPIKAITKALRFEYMDRRSAWEAARREDRDKAKEDAKKGPANAKAKAKAFAMQLVESITPRPRRIQVEDITRERLAEVLSENPRGLVMIQDELSDWLEGMNQYKGGGGNDRNIFLKIWSGSPLTVDRKSQADGIPITVNNPFLCISGGIQPDILPRLSNGGIKDGFIDRFLFTFPEEVQMGFSEEVVDRDAKQDWISGFKRLWDRQSYFSEDDEPELAPFTKPALQRYKDWFNKEGAECHAEGFPVEFKGPWVKYRTYVARFALVLEQLRWAYDPKSVDRVCPVGVEAVDGALTLIDYFKSHYRRVHSKIHGGPRADDPLALDILAWCTRDKKTKFRESDARDNFRRRLASRPQDLAIALRWLEARRCIRRMPSPPKSCGRTPSPVYEVNPLLFSEKRAPNAPNSATG